MTQLTVRQLVALLADEDQDAEVFVEGCDCIGQAEGVDYRHEGAVLITRVPGS